MHLDIHAISEEVLEELKFVSRNDMVSVKDDFSVLQDRISNKLDINISDISQAFQHLELNNQIEVVMDYEVSRYYVEKIVIFS